MGFGEKLAQYLKDNKIDQKELAKLLDVKEQTVSAYITGKNNPTYARFMQICSQLKVDANYFMDSYEDIKGIIPKLSQEDQQIISSYQKLPDSDKRIVDFILRIGECDTNTEPIVTEIQKIYYLPVYQQDVAAGSGQLGFDQKHEMEEFRESNMPKKISYGIKIEGNSMETDNDNNIPDGCTILVTTEFDYDELVGEAVVVNINGVLVCKEYNIAKDGHLWLKSRNRNKENEDKHIYNIDGIKIIGKVVKVIKPNEHE